MTAGVPMYNYPSGAELHFVYRVFDADDRLIYVGCSVNPVARITAHRATAWWADQIHRVESSPAGSRSSAREMEWIAITAEQPRWNLKSRWDSVKGEGLQSLEDYRLAYSRTKNSWLPSAQSHLRNVDRHIQAARQAVTA